MDPNIKSSKTNHDPATFEEAIEKTGFGKFNYMVILMIIPASLSSIQETSTMSYIFAPAQCDLNLSLQDKGYLNSITYAGMITSSFIWGLLLDKFGRKKLMVYGFLLDGLCMFMSGFANSIEVLLVFKFFGGLIINGPFTALIAYLGEIHSSSNRSKIQLVNGSIINLAQILCPLLAWATLPLSIKWVLFNGFIELHSWNFFLFTCSLAPILSAILFVFLPESPKFLMTNGENEKALIVLQKIYSMNTGKPNETFSVKELVIEKEQGKKINRTVTKSFCEAFQNLAPLFKQPILFNFILIAGTQGLFLGGFNMIRLWSPQLFQAVQDYKLYNNGSSTDLCTMLEILQPHQADNICETNVDITVYFNTMTVAVVGMILLFCCITFINKIGKKRFLVVSSWISAVAVCCLFWAKGSVLTTALIAIFISFANICATLTITIGVDFFPTNLRAFVIAIILSIGRIGAMVGNLIFPLLLSLGCAPPFFVVGGIFAVAGTVGWFLPNTEKKALV